MNLWPLNYLYPLRDLDRPEIIYDYFQSIWHPFFDASRNYVENMRGVVRDETVFENFGRYAEDFSSLNRKREKARSEAGRIPPRGEIQ